MILVCFALNLRVGLPCSCLRPLPEPVTFPTRLQRARSKVRDAWVWGVERGFPLIHRTSSNLRLDSDTAFRFQMRFCVYVFSFLRCVLRIRSGSWWQLMLRTFSIIEWVHSFLGRVRLRSSSGRYYLGRASWHVENSTRQQPSGNCQIVPYRGCSFLWLLRSWPVASSGIACPCRHYSSPTPITSKPFHLLFNLSYTKHPWAFMPLLLLDYAAPLPQFHPSDFIQTPFTTCHQLTSG